MSNQPAPPRKRRWPLRRRLKTPRLQGQILGLLGWPIGALGFWLGLEHRASAIMLMLAVPMLALVLHYGSNGKFELARDDKRKGRNVFWPPHFHDLLFAPSVVVFVLGLVGGHLVEPFWAGSAALLVGLLSAIAYHRSLLPAHGRKTRDITVAASMILFGAGAFLGFNETLPWDRQERYEVTILHHHVVRARRGGSSQIFTVAPFGPFARPVEIKGSIRMAKRLGRGDRTCVEYHEGAFGFDWFGLEKAAHDEALDYCPSVDLADR